nr:MAG TPA: hypothetical protein [Caudoviricetes sp.]
MRTTATCRLYLLLRTIMGTPRDYVIVVKQFKGEWHRKVF